MTLRFLIAALLFPCAALAQSRATIPVQDPAYRDIDRLIALRLVDVGLYGQRPYSLREIIRIAREARRAAESAPVSPSTRRIVERMHTRFVEPEPGGVAAASRMSLTQIVEALQLASPPRGIPDDSVGFLEAVLNPLASRRAGRTWFDGGNLAYEVRGQYDVRDRLTMVLHPRLLVAGSDANVYGSVEAASLVVPIRNVTIEAGRQPIVWGQGMEGGLMFSSSGRPLDMLRISTDLPFRGWFIKGTSPMRGSVVAAHLGPNQHFPNSFLIAYKLSGHPFTKRVELAASVLAVQGGRGAPRGTFVDHVVDLIPVLKYTVEDNRAQFSNKMAGWEYRLRLPELSGLQLYAEHAFEDMDPRRWKSTFWEDGGHIVGISLTDLGPDGAVASALEYHHTGLRFYKHGVFRSGLAFNGTLFGDPLGNQGDGGYLRASWDRGTRGRFLADVAIERRDADVYQTNSDGPNEDNFRFEMLQSVPAEWRHRLELAAQTCRGTRDITVRAGVERVRDFQFIRGAFRNNFLLGVSLSGAADACQRP